MQAVDVESAVQAEHAFAVDVELGHDILVGNPREAFSVRGMPAAPGAAAVVFAGVGHASAAGSVRPAVRAS